MNANSAKTTPTTTAHTTPRGFTLVELMIAVAIISLLLGLAMPAYDAHIQKARRSEAREALMDFAARQENFFFNNKTYSNTVAALGRSDTTENGYYLISLPTATATTYTLRATAQSPQDQDTDCATMELTWRGAKTPTDCW